jgi:CRP-like cAMP-binding protein
MWQLRQLMREVNRAGTADMSIEPLLPFMSRRCLPAGSVLFHRGDAAHEMYYILHGTVLLEETGREIGAGQVAGIIGLFAPGQRRPQTGICKTDAEILTLSERQFMQFAYGNPQFTMRLARLITQRALADASAS